MPKPVEITRYILVLAALIGLVMFSWTLGHMLWYSIPELWHHPTIPNLEPEIQIEYGSGPGFPGVQRAIVLSNIPLESMQVAWLETCLGDIYYTSMPAKCQTADGRMIQVGE